MTVPRADPSTVPPAGAGPTAGPGGAYVEVRETHSGIVLLLGERALKLKKPVDLGFLDFSTPDLRLAACHREVELNRRLAPDVYEGVGEIRGAAGERLEPVVLMRRMPDAHRLAHLVVSGGRVEDEVRAVARVVADFHTRCATGPEIAARGTRDAVAARWHANLEEARRFRGGVLPADEFDEVDRLADRFLAGRAPLFDDRVARGAIVDGHGDLLADDIFCLADGPRVLDCLDFDDALRHLDRLDDVACLVMDLERLGADGAARTFREHYLELSGDPAPAGLLDHYVAYRAFMRAKVTCLSTAPGAAEQARRLQDIALKHLRRAGVALVLIGGAPGTGKTVLSGAVADALGAVVLSSDRVRKEIAGITPEDHRPDAFAAGLYAPAHTDATYAELLARAERLLARGETVVLDATWSDAHRRDEAAALAARTASDLVQVRCETPADVAEARIAQRRGGASDADAATARLLRERFAPWTQATAVDTAGSLAAAAAVVRRLVRPHQGP